jgi:hypothetical protein
MKFMQENLSILSLLNHLLFNQKFHWSMVSRIFIRACVFFLSSNVSKAERFGKAKKQFSIDDIWFIFRSSFDFRNIGCCFFNLFDGSIFSFDYLINHFLNLLVFYCLLFFWIFVFFLTFLSLSSTAMI